MKTIRRAIFKQRLEAQLSKYERRIQKMAENAYKVRQVLESMYREEQRAQMEQGTGEGVQRSEVSGDADGAGSPVQGVHQNVQGEIMPDVSERPTESQGAGQDAPAI